MILDALRDAGPARVLVVRSVDGGGALRVVLDYGGESAAGQTQIGHSGPWRLRPSSLVDLALVGLALESPLWAEDSPILIRC